MRALGVHLAASRVAAAMDPFLLLLLLVVVEVRVGALTNECAREAATDGCGGRWCSSAVWGRVARHVALNGRCWVGVWRCGELRWVADWDVARWHLSGVGVYHPVNGCFHHCAGVHHGMHGKMLLLAVWRQVGCDGHVVLRDNWR